MQAVAVAVVVVVVAGAVGQTAVVQGVKAGATVSARTRLQPL